VVHIETRRVGGLSHKHAVYVRISRGHFSRDINLRRLLEYAIEVLVAALPWPPSNTYQTLNKSMPKSDEAKAREHRLAAKLRENLRRRKAPVAVPDVDEPAIGKVPGGTEKNSGKS